MNIYKPIQLFRLELTFIPFYVRVSSLTINSARYYSDENLSDENLSHSDSDSDSPSVLSFSSSSFPPVAPLVTPRTSYSEPGLILYIPYVVYSDIPVRFGAVILKSLQAELLLLEKSVPLEKYVKYNFLVYDAGGDGCTVHSVTHEDLLFLGAIKAYEKFLGSKAIYNYASLNNGHIDFSIKAFVSHKPFSYDAEGGSDPYLDVKVDGSHPTFDATIRFNTHNQPLDELLRTLDLRGYINSKGTDIIGDKIQIKLDRVKDNTYDNTYYFDFKVFDLKNNIALVAFTIQDTLDKDNNMIRREYRNIINYYKDNRYNYTEYRLGLAEHTDYAVEDDIKLTEFGTIDVETYLDKEGYHKIYAVGIYTPQNSKTWYLTDYESIDDLILDVLDYLAKKSIKTLWGHNAGRYDTILLMDVLRSLDENRSMNLNIRGKARGSTIINLVFSYKKKRFELKDSFLLLGASLWKLCEGFKTDTIKGHFPHSFVKRERLEYVGQKPPIKNYQGISQADYSQIPEEFNLKAACIKYLEADCKSLYEVLVSFEKENIELFKLNPLKYLTISSYALDLWKRTIKTPICVIPPKSIVFKAISEAFYGGIAEVYEPYTQSGTSLDVNSLYPFIMAENKMPIGDCYWSNHPDLDRYNGFCFVDVDSQFTRKAGALPFRFESHIICPEGTWSGWYSTSELKNAVAHGYKVEVIQGYNFKKSENIFKAYVYNIYSIKASDSAKGARYTIAKLLLNSLYGRFALHIGENTAILSKKEVGENLSMEEILFLDSSMNIEKYNEWFKPINDFKINTDKPILDPLTDKEDKPILDPLTDKEDKPDLASTDKKLKGIPIKDINDLKVSQNNAVIKPDLASSDKKLKGIPLKDINDLKVSQNNAVINYTENKGFRSADDLFLNKAISAEIAALARVYMLPIRNHPNTAYTATDSAAITVTDPDQIKDYVSIGKNLGDWKVEHEFKEALFIKNNFYAYINKEDRLITKTSGVPKDSTFTRIDFNKLKEWSLKKVDPKEDPNTLKLETQKIQTNIADLTIRTNKQVIHLTNNYTGRIKVFDKNNSWIGTYPIKLVNGRKTANWYESMRPGVLHENSVTFNRKLAATIKAQKAVALRNHLKAPWNTLVDPTNPPKPQPPKPHKPPKSKQKKR